MLFSTNYLSHLQAARLLQEADKGGKTGGGGKALSVEERLKAAEADVAKLKLELANATGQHNSLESERDAARKESAEKTASLDKANARVIELQGRVTKLNDSLAKANEEKNAAEAARDEATVKVEQLEKQTKDLPKTASLKAAEITAKAGGPPISDKPADNKSELPKKGDGIERKGFSRLVHAISNNIQPAAT